MKATILVTAGVLAFFSSALAQSQPPAPPMKPVTETFFGQKVTDNYRYMEDLGPETLDWIKAQGAYTRNVLDSVKPRAALIERVSALTGSFGLATGYVAYGGRVFYQERAPGSDNFDLIVRDSAGTRKLVDIAAWRAAHGGKPFAINYFQVSPDGAKAAIGISAGGSEAAELFVYDAATGNRIAGPIDRADFGTTAWSGDSQKLFFIRLQKLAPGQSDNDHYKNSTANVWDLKSEPTILAGHGIGEVPFAPEEVPAVFTIAGSKLAMLQSLNGVQNELKVWTASAASAATKSAKWRLLSDRDDGITAVEIRGNDIFLLSHKNAPTFQVLSLKAEVPLAAAKVLVPADRERVIDAIHVAADGLYVLARKGAYSQLLRVPVGSSTQEEIALPIKGHVDETFADPRVPGLAFSVSSWVTPQTWFQYEPASRQFTDLNLGTAGAIDPAQFAVSDLEARAKDGVMVPLSLVQTKGAATPQITLLRAYGAYGDSQLADFSPSRAAILKEKIAMAVCHVRGGGEKGESWRLGGKDANKHNTWEDLIACAEDLIARGVTTKDRLFIIGGSAGGIPMGRAMTERPDLFAGVLDLVPLANPLRFEFSSNALNVPEFGSIHTEEGFKNLYAMDSVQHVKSGVKYPPVMITTGLNDPRVAPWLPAKFAAALLDAGAPNPVLLRFDTEAGHGIGSTKSQSDALTADLVAFIFWHAGMPEWWPSSIPSRAAQN